MIQLRLLGSLDLRSAEGIELRSVLSQPKRVALLAYLAVQGGGFHRRDKLLAVFWPESDTERARGALRRALYFLRQSLGEGVLVSRGDEEVGIAEGALRCDAAEFVRLLETGEAAQALELYRGDLLEGFFVSEAPDFDRWLEEERGLLRGRAAWAAWLLAGEAEAAGDFERAAQLARRAVSLADDSEPAVRRWMELLVRSGDPAGALRAYDELAERLAREYEVEPAPETRALAESVRAGASATPRAGPPVSAAPPSQEHEAVPAVASTGHAAVATLGEPEQAEVAGPVRPHQHARSPRILRLPRLPVWGVLLPLILAAAIGGLLLVPHSRPVPAMGAGKDVVAVLPFSYYGSGESAYLGEGIVRLLSANLNGAGSLRTVDPRALLSVIDREEIRPGDADGARALAERFGAGTIVQGHVIEAGGQLRITAVLSDRAAGRSEVTVEGGADRLFDLVDELTAKLLAVQSAEPGARLTRLAAVTTHSLPALKAYLEGEADLQDGRYDAAFDAFERAVGADSSFALAHYRLSYAAHWLNNYLVGDSARVRARRLSSRLPRRDRFLVEGWTLHSSGVPLGAERLYRAVVTEHPDDVEAWFQLGEVLFHWGPSAGRPLTEAKEPFERVLAYEPADAGALIHLARIAALEGDRTGLAALADRIQALQPVGDQALEIAVLRAFALGDRAEIERLNPRLATASPELVLRTATALAVFTGDLAAAAELVSVVTAPDREPGWRARGRLLRAQLEMARGRWHAAQRDLAGIERFPEQFQYLSGAEYRAALATFPFLSLSRDELEAIRREVIQLPQIPSIELGSPGQDLPLGIYGAHRHYLVGLLSARLGDPVAALQEAMRLETYRGSAQDSAMAHALARGIRAQVAWMGGQPLDALRLLPEPGVWADQKLPRLENYPKDDERFLYAELLRAAGRDEEALRWYATFPDASGADLIYLAPSHLRRAEIHEQRGEREKAIEHYQRFVNLWKDADPEFQPLLRKSEQRLLQLQNRQPSR